MLGRYSALFACLVYLKGLLISTTFQTEAITSFSYVIGLKTRCYANRLVPSPAQKNT